MVLQKIKALLKDTWVHFLAGLEDLLQSSPLRFLGSSKEKML